MSAGRYQDSLAAFNQGTSLTITNATLWNNKGVVLTQLQQYQDAVSAFKRALNIDPSYTEAQQNLEKAMGKGQVFIVTGTITPVPTISRLGTLNPATTVPTPTTTVTVIQETTVIPSEQAPVTTVPVPMKTTYSPSSPVTVLAALIGASGILFVIKNLKK